MRSCSRSAASPRPRSSRRSALRRSLRGDEPGGIEPAVGLAVVRQPRDVPVADEGRIGFPNRGPASDIDHAVREPGQDLGRMVRRADLANGPILIGKGRDRGDGGGPRDDHVTARDLEEPSHIGSKFASLVALPGKPAVQPQLPALAYGAYGANVSHALLLFDAAPVKPVTTLAADGVLAKIDAETRLHDAPPHPLLHHRPAPKTEGDRAHGPCHALLCRARLDG